MPQKLIQRIPYIFLQVSAASAAINPDASAQACYRRPYVAQRQFCNNHLYYCWTTTAATTPRVKFLSPKSPPFVIIIMVALCLSLLLLLWRRRCSGFGHEEESKEPCAQLSVACLSLFFLLSLSIARRPYLLPTHTVYRVSFMSSTYSN